MNFNPHPHAEGDNNDNTVRMAQWDFNPHPHAEGDPVFRLVPSLY